MTPTQLQCVSCGLRHCRIWVSSAYLHGRGNAQNREGWGVWRSCSGELVKRLPCETGRERAAARDFKEMNR